jgi:hypothetical protein
VALPTCGKPNLSGFVDTTVQVVSEPNRGVTPTPRFCSGWSHLHIRDFGTSSSEVLKAGKF